MEVDSTFGLIRLADLLELTEDQKKKVVDLAKSTDDDINEEIDRFVNRLKEIRSKGQESTVECLSEQQKTAYQSWVGGDFFTSSDFSRRLIQHANKVQMMSDLSHAFCSIELELVDAVSHSPIEAALIRFFSWSEECSK